MKHVAIFLTASILAGAAFAIEPVSGVNVVTGGVGETERAQVKSQEGNYNLKLVFTGEGGIYLGDVAVIVRDKAGNEVVNGKTDGPFLLAELKPGSYTVDATDQGFQKQQTIQIGSQLRTYYMRFPIKDE